MTKPVAAPEIFQIPLDQIDLAIVPPGTKPGTTEFEQAVIMHYALRYAAKGWHAMVTVNDGIVHVLAIPQQGMDPKDYVQGLLQNGFLEDSLPILQALDGMIEDADISYNLGICFSELGQTVESVEPLERCTRLASDYTVPLKPKGYSKKKRTFGMVELQFMDGVEGRFVGLLPEVEKQNLH